MKKTAKFLIKMLAEYLKKYYKIKLNAFYVREQFTNEIKNKVSYCGFFVKQLVHFSSFWEIAFLIIALKQ